MQLDPPSSTRRARDRRPLIVHVVYRFSVGGLENGIVNLINHLPPRDFRHAVVALTQCEPLFCKRVERDDVSFVSLDKSAGQGWRLFRKVARLFSGLGPAIVHTRNLAALEMQLPARLAGVPVRIHGEHGRDVTDPDGTNRLYQRVRRVYRPFVTHYVAVSRDLEDYLVERVGVSRARVRCICNGVDDQRFKPQTSVAIPSPCNRRSAARPVVIGTVGRLQEVKGHSTLIAAVEHLVRAEPGRREAIRVRIIGDGPLRSALAGDVRARGLDDVIEFLGEREDVPALMRALDVFALPSLAEGISNTVLEAMATGLPIVATAVGGTGELVAHESTGFLVPAEDSEAMAQALAKYVDSADLRLRHGAEARQQVETRFTLSGMVDRYAALYNEALGSRLEHRVAVRAS